MIEKERMGGREGTNVSRIERSHLLPRFPSPPRFIHGVCNFNYFISGNPWNIQRRYGMEGELVHVAVLNRPYFSSSRKRSSLLCPLLLTDSFLYLEICHRPSATLLHFRIVLPSFPLSPAPLDSIPSTRYVTIALKLSPILIDIVKNLTRSTGWLTIVGCPNTRRRRSRMGRGGEKHVPGR